MMMVMMKQGALAVPGLEQGVLNHGTVLHLLGQYHSIAAAQAVRW